MPFNVGELAHFCVGRGVVDECREFGDFPVGGAIGFDRFDDGAELGEFARQLDVGVGTQTAGELAFHQRMAGEQGVQFLLRQDGQSCNPSVAAKPSSLWRIDTLPTGCARQGRSISSPLRQSSPSRSAFTGPTAEGVSDRVR